MRDSRWWEICEVLTARMRKLITARARKNKRTARMLAIALKGHSISLVMSSASSLATSGTSIRCKDGKVKTATVVDAGNLRMSCHVAKDKMLNVISRVILG